MFRFIYQHNKNSCQVTEWLAQDKFSIIIFKDRLQVERIS